MTQSSALTESGKPDHLYNFWSKQACPWVNAINKLFKTISHGMAALAFVTPLGRASEAAAWFGRVRPVFYTAFLGRDIPKLWRKDGLKKTLKGPDRDYAQSLFTVLAMTFSAAFVTKGAFDALSHIRRFKRLKSALAELTRALPLIIIATNLAGFYLFMRKAVDESDNRANASVKAGEQATNLLGTAFATEYIEFEDDLFLSQLLRACSGFLGLSSILLDRAKRNNMATETDITETDTLYSSEGTDYGNSYSNPIELLK